MDVVVAQYMNIIYVIAFISSAILLYVASHLEFAICIRLLRSVWNIVTQGPVARFFAFLTAVAKWLLSCIFWMADIPPPLPCPKFDDILLRCLRSCAQRRNLQVRLPRSTDAFIQLRILPFFGSLRRTGLESYMYMACNPANKEENLSKALLHFLYNRLRIEAMSRNLANPDGSFDLLAECPGIAKTPGLKYFPDMFKVVKDIAMREVFEGAANVDQLSDTQWDLMTELIKMVMIKKVYEDLEDFEASVGRIQLHRLIDRMASSKFVPSTKDMLKLISKSLSTSVHVLVPGKKVGQENDVYAMHTIEKTCTTATPISPVPLILYMQGKDSYTLVKPPKQLHNQQS